MFVMGRIVFLLFVFTSCHALTVSDLRDVKGVHMLLKRAEQRTTPPPKVLIDTGKELRLQFIALYILFPICLVECCICLPIGEWIYNCIPTTAL